MSARTSSRLHKNILPIRPASAPKRRRGGQSDNTNTLKHGFYSSHFRRSDLKDLDNCEFSGIKDEITMLRVNIRRCIEFSDQVTTLSEAMELLRTLSLASIALALLIKTQYLLAPGTDPISELINQILEEMQVEDQINNTSNLQNPPASQYREDTPAAIG
jgi:hypothetical protein